MLPWNLTKVMSHNFHATDDQAAVIGMTVYGHSGKFFHTLSVTLTMQQPYMAIQDKFVICYL